MDITDRLDIIDTTTRMAWLADRRAWDDLVEVFADEVDVDYTSLTGGEPATVAAADLVAGWRAGLGGLDATQHHVSNHLVTPTDDGAEVSAQFIPRIDSTTSTVTRCGRSAATTTSGSSDSARPGASGRSR